MATGHGGSVKVILAALLANLGIALAKLAGWFFTGSASLLAETIHSFVDCTNQVLLLIGNDKSKKPPTERHPFGFGREAFFWSFIVAILLFSMGGLFAIYEGIHKLESHETLSNPLVALIILLVSIGLEAGSLIACLNEIRSQNRFGNLWTWFQKTTSSDLLVVFTEDVAALTGLVLATVFLVLAWVTGNPVWDAIGSIAIGVVLVIVAIVVAIEIKSLMIGEAPGIDMRPEAEALLKEVIPGARMFRFLAMQTGAHEVTVAMKISPGSLEKTSDLIDSINEFERRMRQRFPEIRWQFVEPDVAD